MEETETAKVEPATWRKPHPERFFMVFVEGGDVPVVKHKRFLEARWVAKKMSAKLGRPAYVLQSTYKTRVAPTPTSEPSATETPAIADDITTIDQETA